MPGRRLSRPALKRPSGRPIRSAEAGSGRGRRRTAPPVISGFTRGPSGSASTCWVPILVALLVGRLPHAAAAPSVLLFGATPDEARDFAVQSASARGWSVPSIGEDSIEFEQILAVDDLDDPDATRVLIRISASILAESAGTRVVLHAREVESSAEGEWETDVTDRYERNLGNALQSLLGQWDRHRGGGSDPVPDSWRALAYTPEHRDAALGGDPRPPGSWAYYAERYAQGRGCDLADVGSSIEASGPEWERHRVPCRDGQVFTVDCLNGDCTSSR